MTSGHSPDIREVIFVNEGAKQDYENLPEPVREAADARTTALQNNQRMPSGQAAALSGNLKGIVEIRISHDGQAFRVYDAVEFPEVVYVLDAGIKKSKQGGQIPREDVERLLKRKAAADEDYALNADLYRRRFGARERFRQGGSRK